MTLCFTFKMVTVSHFKMKTPNKAGQRIGKVNSFLYKTETRRKNTILQVINSRREIQDRKS